MLEISNAALFAELVNKRFPLFVLLAVAMHTVFFAIYTELILGSRWAPSPLARSPSARAWPETGPN